MKKYVSFLVFFCLNSLAHEACAQQLSIADAIHIGVQNNLSIQNAYLSRQSQRNAHRSVKSLFEPVWTADGQANTLSSYDTAGDSRSGSASFGAGLSLSLSTLSGARFAITARETANYADDTRDSLRGSIDITITQPLLRGRGEEVASAPLQESRYALAIAELALEQTLTSIITQIILAYRQLLIAEKASTIAAASHERAEQQIDINDALIRSGRLAAVEQIQARTDLARRELDARQSENAISSARTALLRLLRLPTETNLQLSDRLEITAPDETLDQLLMTAIHERPDYETAQIQGQLSGLRLTVARNNEQWQIDAELGYALARSGRPPRNAFDHFDNFHDQGDYRAGIRASKTLNDISAETARKAAEIAIRQSENQIRDLEDNIRLEVAEAHRNLSLLWEQISLADRSLELSREQLRLEQLKLQAGRTSNFQIISFENALVSAEQAALSARINYLNARTRLDQSVGRTLERWNVMISSDTPAALRVR